MKAISLQPSILNNYHKEVKIGVEQQVSIESIDSTARAELPINQSKCNSQSMIPMETTQAESYINVQCEKRGSMTRYTDQDLSERNDMQNYSYRDGTSENASKKPS